MGYNESFLAVEIIYLMKVFLEKHDLGIVLGEAGTLQILPHQVRVPDVCFISWDRFPNRQLPPEPIPALAPDLAIEVLSQGNTEQEMQRKLHDYFTAGVRLVWYIDPRTRSAKSYTAENQFVEIVESQSLSGGDVLPGFRVAVARIVRQDGAIAMREDSILREIWRIKDRTPPNMDTTFGHLPNRFKNNSAVGAETWCHVVQNEQKSNENRIWIRKFRQLVVCHCFPYRLSRFGPYRVSRCIQV